MHPLVNRILTSFAVGLLLTLGAAFNAKAGPVTIARGQSVTFIFTSPTFAASTARAVFSLNSTGNVLTVVATNTSTNGTFLSGVGFNTTPNVTLVSATATNGFTAGAGSSGGLGGYELVDYGNGNNSRLAPGGTTTATFTFNQNYTQLTIDQVIAHLTSLPNGNSEKPVGVLVNTPLPEPATLLLLGTGLAGIGAKLRRRRKL